MYTSNDGRNPWPEIKINILLIIAQENLCEVQVQAVWLG